MLGVGEVLPFSPAGGAQRRCRSTWRGRSSRLLARGTAGPRATCTSRSRRAPRAPRCATRARSTSAPSTPRPSASSPRRWRARVVELFFGRLDARTASFAATRGLLQRWFPGDYRVILPGADPPAAEAEAAKRAGEDERPLRDRLRRPTRSARRCAPFLRALRRMPAERRLGGHRLVAPRRPAHRRPAARRAAHAHATSSAPTSCDEDALLARADVVVRRLRRGGAAPGGLLRALGRRRRPRRRRGCPSTRSWSARASAGCCSSRATPRRCAAHARRARADAGAARAAARRGRRRCASA